jgi:hypothetical protein
MLTAGTSSQGEDEYRQEQPSIVYLFGSLSDSIPVFDEWGVGKLHDE